MLHTGKKVNGAILRANFNLLFWLSLMPFTTAWMGENRFATMPVVFYAIDLCLCLYLCLCAVSYTLLQAQIIKSQGGFVGVGSLHVADSRSPH